MADDNFPTPNDFLLKTPLYNRLEVVGEEVWKAIGILYFRNTYDSYCSKCRRESTFQVEGPERPDKFIRDYHGEAAIKRQGLKVPLPKLEPGTYDLQAKCTRQSAHSQVFLLLVETEYESGNMVRRTFLQKIGQHPSFGDIHIARVKQYAPVLTKPQLAELTRAIGLASHDVGVGAYVYLRRIFEALVEEARALAQQEEGWDEQQYMRSRMSEKIGLLEHHLPSFLTEHPEMYSLLSKGVHELSEAECLRHFDTLRIGIELILDEKLERQKRAAKIKDAKAALSKAVCAAND